MTVAAVVSGDAVVSVAAVSTAASRASGINLSIRANRHPVELCAIRKARAAGDDVTAFGPAFTQHHPPTVTIPAVVFRPFFKHSYAALDLSVWEPRFNEIAFLDGVGVDQLLRADL